MGKFNFMLVVLVQFWHGASDAQTARRICDDITLISQKPIDFNATERDLVCNDPKQGPWSRIPPWQKEYFLRVFLQSRGYFHPKITTQNDHTSVAAGPLVVIRTIELENNQLAINPLRYWKLYGAALTPTALNSLEKMLTSDHSRRGYPCVQLGIKAYPDEQTVRVDIQTGQQKRFPPVSSQPIPGLLPKIERRYDAFATGDLYDSLLLDLTARRIVGDQLVESAAFSTGCSEDQEEITVEQTYTLGKPNLFTLGLGFDTEEYLIAELGWKNSRLYSTATTFESGARFSYRTQHVSISSNWHYSRKVNRHFIKSSLMFKRQNEKSYDSRTLQLQAGPYWYSDADKVFYSVWLAPAFRHIEVLRGAGPVTTQSLALKLNSVMMSHEFEYFSVDPRRGFRWSLDYGTEGKNRGSDISAESYLISGTHLWNLFHYEPPLWVLGLRLQLGATVAGPDTKNAEIPTNLKYRLGGSRNVRGFARERIPEDGALMFAYSGLELRVNNFFWAGLQPLVFADFGKIGNNQGEMARSTFWSPGVGVQWNSLIGVIRGTLAHGLIQGREQERLSHLERWQLYVSLGEQF
jgi:outer membrane translocation and assembly module TamA